MTRAPNNFTKLEQEYLSVVVSEKSDLLLIRLIPGMEMLAKELSTGAKIFDQDWRDPLHHPDRYPTSPASPDFRPFEDEGLLPIDSDPSPYPISPNAPNAGRYQASPNQVSPFSSYEAAHAFEVIQRRRSQRWSMDALDAYPVLLIEESKVQFYSNRDELEQAVKNRSKDDAKRLLINMAHVVSIEKVSAIQSFAQNAQYADVMVGHEGKTIPVQIQPLTIIAPTSIPQLSRPEDELMFRVQVDGGVPPYTYQMVGQPPDLWVSSDGWVRGFIEDEVWPTSGYREFLIRLVVRDSSIPRQIAVLDFRYRLFPKA